MKKIIIPRHIDSPPNLLMWSLDEIAPILIGILAGVILKKMLLMILLGWGASVFYKKKKESSPDGFFFHYLFWHSGINISNAKTMVNPFIRRLFP